MFQIKVVKKTKTHIVCPIIFFFENRAVYEIMWNNIVEPQRAQEKKQWKEIIEQAKTHKEEEEEEGEEEEEEEEEGGGAGEGEEEEEEEEEYCRAGQATDKNTRCMLTECWIIKVTNTHSEYVILIVFPLQGCTNAS
jgi:flagellar biosynthesis/type III secretory pathway M-ring protein FliF/YscJ